MLSCLVCRAAATSDRFAVGQPRGKMVMKPLVVVLNVCNYGIPTDPEVSHMGCSRLMAPVLQTQSACWPADVTGSHDIGLLVGCAKVL